MMALFWTLAWRLKSLGMAEKHYQVMGIFGKT